MNNSKRDLSPEITGFQEEIADIQTAIADYESGINLNIAVIAEPFAGRTTLVSEIEKMNHQKVTKLSLASIVKHENELTLPDPSKRIVLIDDCQFLYMRKINGFNILEDFLTMIVSTNKLFITTWNLYSWNYLDGVMKISKFFPVQVMLHKFDTEEIKECILSKYEDDEIKFVEDAPFEKERLIEFTKKPLTIKPLKKTFNIPSMKINHSVLEARLFKKEEKIETEDIIFDKIKHISNGNPGVVKVIWQKSLEYPTIKPGKIKEFSFNIDLDYNESFVLGIILSMKSIEKDELAEIVGPDFLIDEILFKLIRQGLITIDNDGCCTIAPEALHSIVEFLKKLRVVW